MSSNPVDLAMLFIFWVNVISSFVIFFNLRSSKTFIKLFHFGFIDVISNLPLGSKNWVIFFKNKYISSESSNKSVITTRSYFFGIC